MFEDLTRFGPDLSGPSLVAYVVVALCAGLLGAALGSSLQSRRVRRHARPALHDGRSADPLDLASVDRPAPSGLRDAPTGYDTPASEGGYDQPGLGWASPLMMFSEPGAPKARPTQGLAADGLSEAGLDRWSTSAARRSAGLKLAGLVAFAAVSVAASLWVGTLLSAP